jgi:hypothetical protein
MSSAIVDAVEGSGGSHMTIVDAVEGSGGSRMTIVARTVEVVGSATWKVYCI